MTPRKEMQRMKEEKFQELTPEMKKEVEKIDLQMDSTQANLAAINVDTKAVAVEQEPQTKMSQREILKYDAPYIKPTRRMPATSKKKSEQEKMRNSAWEYIKCIVENHEVQGESVEFWYCPPLSGEDINYWQVPVNIPVYIPRMIAEHLSTRSYNRIVMRDRPVDQLKGEMMVEGASQPSGQLISAEKRKRIDCRPAEVFAGNIFK